MKELRKITFILIIAFISSIIWHVGQEKAMEQKRNQETKKFLLNELKKLENETDSIFGTIYLKDKE